MSASEGEQATETQVMDAWVAEQLAAFAPLGPADLVTLAAILGYDAAVVSDEAA
jgi:hypothetical protein